MFIWRLLFLTVLLALIAWWDYRRLGPAARRWQEYLFLYSAGAFAALLGALNDVYTVSVSPDYFISGKGLEAGDGLILRAMGLGAQAGFVAGVILAACLLMRYRYAFWSDLARQVVRITCLAVMTALLCRFVLPMYLVDTDLLSAVPWTNERKLQFVHVWSIHIGLYVGAALGLLAILCVVKLPNRDMD